MRERAYWLFALVAWPAAVWGCIEVVLRIATTNFNGVAPLLALTASAFATIVATRWRRHALAPIRTSSRTQG